MTKACDKQRRQTFHYLLTGSRHQFFFSFLLSGHDPSQADKYVCLVVIFMNDSLLQSRELSPTTLDVFERDC